MAKFSQEQLDQLNEIFGEPLAKRFGEQSLRFDKQFDELSQQINAVNNDLGQRIDTVNQRIDNVNQRIDGQTKRFGDLSQQIGAVNERLIRKDVAQVHGETFARGLIIMSLEDLARFVQDCDVGRYVSAKDLIDATNKLASVLLSTAAAERFIRRLHTCISTVDTSQADTGLAELVDLLQQHPWFDAAGRLETQSLGRWIGKLGNNHSNLRKVVGGVKSVVDATTPAQVLLKVDPDGSIGIVLAQFAADEQQYCASALRKYEDLVLPSWRVQCDVQGNIMVFDTKAQLSVGEVKSSSSGYRDGVVQLVRRLALMQWVVMQLRPAIKEFFKVGHLYMPRDDSKNQSLKPTTEGDALIYVHYM